MNLLKQEFQYQLAAIRYFTRIPVPLTTAHDPASLNQALKYFPLVGWLIGGLSALAFYLAVGIWPNGVAVILCIVLGVLLTGALHEDGFADSCDGFGGGWDKPQVLSIMKDPCIGSYAAIGLILILAVKIMALIAIADANPDLILIVLVLAHSASRWLVLPLPWLLQYVRETDDSKSREMVETPFTAGMFAYSSLFILLPLLWLQMSVLVYAVTCAAIAVMAMALYFRRRIGGYTGDCLGATQQLAEIVIYLAVLGLWTSQ